MSGQCERGESLGKNKRKHEGTNIDKGKENVVSNLIDEVENDNLIGDSESTQSTRTPRGPTQMDRLVVQRHKGNKLHIEFNDLGQPIGKVATEMQSYIGVLARKKVKITYKSWKHVPNDVRDDIWETVKMVFNVDSTWEKGCLSTANEKWRQYKTHLTQDYIFPNLDNPEQLNKVPKDSCILPEDWSKFVMSRMADNFTKNSEKQQERRAKSLYPHRLSRKGYARFADEVADELSDNDNDINRALLLMKGRLNKEGEFVGDQLKSTATKIKKDRKLKYVDPKQDILTSALESKEHVGRVRAVEGYVTPTLYFNVAKGKPSVEKTNFFEQQKRLIDQEKKNSEQEDRIQKLESMIYRNGLHDFKNDEKVDSCSVKFPPTIFANELKNGNFGPSNEINADSDDEDVKLINKANALQGKPVALTLESGINVAFGTVVKVGGVGENINGAPLHKNCMGISIDEALDESAALPVPNSSTYLSVGDVVGSHVAWPIHLIKTRDEFTKAEYSKEDIDEVRTEWAECLQDHIYDE
ncbi:hypothetical protein DH2020_015852 [Rehmannia glutinosa]|uniref:Transposase Tnp1/En/Spm-like domain-containing protein n=1 Tax=Rehmannia glutinosa TaxID=99300 RepID=A0ABR0WUN8_REHGL